MRVRSMMTENLEIDGVIYTLNIHYEQRNNGKATIKKGSINIRIPLGMNREEQFQQLMKMKAWVKKKLQENKERFKPAPQKEYRDGDLLRIGNDEFRLDIRFKDKQSSFGRVDGNDIELVISSNLPPDRQKEHVSTLLSRVIAGKRLPGLKRKIEELNSRHFSQKINGIYFKHNKSNWGSCSSKGNINISTRLLFAPDDVLEYVCIHELAHLIEPNHSDTFWNLVQTAMPEYKEKEGWLKENGGNCQF